MSISLTDREMRERKRGGINKISDLEGAERPENPNLSLNERELNLGHGNGGGKSTWTHPAVQTRGILWYSTKHRLWL